MGALEHRVAPLPRRRAERFGRLAPYGALFLCLAAVAAFFAAYDALERPIGVAAGAPAAVSAALTRGDAAILVVKPGFGVSDVARELLACGFDVDERLFRLGSRWFGLDRRIQAGEYSVRAAMSTRTLFDLFRRGEVVQYRVTIPEGFTAKEIASRLAAHGLVAKDRFLKLVGRPELVFPGGLPEELKGITSLEGYLYPDTYVFTGVSSEEDIARTMVKRFLEVALPLYHKSSLAGSHSLGDLVTLASIVEGEAAVDRERPVIAGVFLNRLERRMPLESCATVEYALGVHKEVLSLKDVAVDSPYNTYRNLGLPPTPIANPGRKSLAAAMNPARGVPYLFFVARGDGSHVFSRTFAEHRRAQAAVADLTREPRH